MNIFKLIFFLQLFLLAVLFVSCGEDHKCSQDFQCDSGSFCSVDSKCLDFAEGDYDITISPLEDDCSVSENVEVEVILNRKSEKLHDAMAVALKVENNDSYEILENAFYKDKSFFNLKISYCTYKLSAFLV